MERNFVRKFSIIFRSLPVCARLRCPLVPPFLPKYVIVRGVGGVPELFWGLESSYFCYLGAQAKFQNPTTIPSGKMRERRKRFPLTLMGVLASGSAHTIPSARHPIDMSGNFPSFLTYFLQTSPITPQKSYLKF